MTGTTLELYEYYWNGTTYNTFIVDNTIPAGILTFDLKPEEVTKSIELPWRISKLGIAVSGRRRGQKAKWRKCVKCDWQFTGGCNDTFRKTLEFYAVRWSKFRVRFNGKGGPDDTPYKGPQDEIFGMISPEPQYWGQNEQTLPPTFAYERLFVVISSCEFSMTSKPNWYRYTIKLSRVDEKDVVASN